MGIGRGRASFLAIALMVLAAGARPQDAATRSAPALSSVQIAEQMQLHDRARTLQLKHYQALRHYQVEYRGFSTTVEASMAVEVSYDAASGKSFQIISQSGSRLLLEKVIVRAIDSEREASHNKASMALTPANYRFILAGTSIVGSRPAYILDVEPLRSDKFLYRGKIWVDAADFAVVKMETQPARSPSFWISKTLIHCTNAHLDGFWLPEKLRSETRVRIGGTAILTIDYGTYRIASTPPLDQPLNLSLDPPPTPRH